MSQASSKAVKNDYDSKGVELRLRGGALCVLDRNTNSNGTKPFGKTQSKPMGL